jgi:hypothetical protein
MTRNPNWSCEHGNNENATIAHGFCDKLDRDYRISSSWSCDTTTKDSNKSRNLVCPVCGGSRPARTITGSSLLRNGILSRKRVYRQIKPHGRFVASVAVILILAAVVLPIFNIATDNLVVCQMYTSIDEGCECVQVSSSGVECVQVQVRGSLTYVLFQCGEVHEFGVVLDPNYTGKSLGGATMWVEKFSFSCLG